MGTDWPLAPRLPNVTGMTDTNSAKNRAEVLLEQLEPQGDEASLANGMLLRQDPDREAAGQILRDTLARIDASRQGCSYLVVASFGGSDKHPGWYHNLRNRPDCEINVGSKRFAARARKATPDDADYARLWEVVNKNNANRYTGYQSRTSRPIPVIALTPA